MGFGGTDHPVTFRRFIIVKIYSCNYCELVGHCRSWRSAHGCRLRGTGRRPRRGFIVVVLHRRRRDQDPAGHRRLHRRGGRSGHDKLLDLRAERHADAARADPTDFDAHYSWALVLQEQAERAEQSGMDPNRRDAILIDACAKYAKARDLRANSISTLYNWGIALGDRARLKGDAGDAAEARAMWRQACEKYRAAVECDASRTQSTQALNNWGLALQQMATLERDPGARASTPGGGRAVSGGHTAGSGVPSRGVQPRDDHVRAVGARAGARGTGPARREVRTRVERRSVNEHHGGFKSAGAPRIRVRADERGRAPDRRRDVHMLRASVRREARVRIVPQARQAHPTAPGAPRRDAHHGAPRARRRHSAQLAAPVVRAGPRGALDGGVVAGGRGRRAAAAAAAMAERAALGRVRGGRRVESFLDVTAVGRRRDRPDGRPRRTEGGEARASKASRGGGGRNPRRARWTVGGSRQDVRRRVRAAVRGVVAPSRDAFRVGMADGSSHYFVCDDDAARSDGWTR